MADDAPETWQGLPLTPPIPCSTPPTEPGLYQRRYRHGRAGLKAWEWSRFDGTRWYLRDAHPQHAQRETCAFSLGMVAACEWRGLAVDPTDPRQPR